MNTNTGRDNPLWDVLRSQPTPADCQRCREHLHDYVQNQLDDQDVDSTNSWVARHLDACVECASAYAPVYDTLFAEKMGQLPVPAAMPDPDLSFLPVADNNLATKLRSALTATSAQITLQFDAVLRALLTPPPAAALVRSGADGRYHKRILSLPPDPLAADASLPFTLVAYADSQHPQLCLVEVTLQLPDQSWPDLGGYAVTLTLSSGSHTTLTDDWGSVAFADILQSELDTLKCDVALTK